MFKREKKMNDQIVGFITRRALPASHSGDDTLCCADCKESFQTYDRICIGTSNGTIVLFHQEECTFDEDDADKIDEYDTDDRIAAGGHR